uniref:Uncharacterized protein n=1 Tax=Arundo donax TaxID=35708 RepID=A0A0A8ZU73_ARUDO
MFSVVFLLLACYNWYEAQVC